MGASVTDQRSFYNACTMALLAGPPFLHIKIPMPETFFAFTIGTFHRYLLDIRHWYQKAQWETK